MELSGASYTFGPSASQIAPSSGSVLSSCRPISRWCQWKTCHVRSRLHQRDAELEKTHLDGEIEKTQVPTGSGDDILVHQRHADGGQAVRENRGGGIIANRRSDTRPSSRDVAITLRLARLVGGKQFLLADAFFRRRRVRLVVARIRLGVCRRR